jgi:hypothetical protein
MMLIYLKLSLTPLFCISYIRSVQDLWCTKWKWAGFSMWTLITSCQLSFHNCPIFISHLWPHNRPHYRGTQSHPMPKIKQLVVSYSSSTSMRTGWSKLWSYEVSSWLLQFSPGSLHLHCSGQHFLNCVTEQDSVYEWQRWKNIPDAVSSSKSTTKNLPEA